MRYQVLMSKIRVCEITSKALCSFLWHNSTHFIIQDKSCFVWSQRIPVNINSHVENLSWSQITQALLSSSNPPVRRNANAPRTRPYSAQASLVRLDCVTQWRGWRKMCAREHTGNRGNRNKEVLRVLYTSSPCPPPFRPPCESSRCRGESCDALN